MSIVLTGIDLDGKELTVHVLRKCCGQNWANKLPMNVVKELMGHADITTTAEFYSAVDDEHRNKAKEVVNRLLETGQKTVDMETTDHKMTFSDNLESNLDKTIPENSCENLANKALEKERS